MRHLGIREPRRHDGRGPAGVVPLRPGRHHGAGRGHVTWTNSDHFTHTVQFLDGGLPPDPVQLEPGASTTFRFETPGLYHYQCSLHPQNMKGTVEVTPQGG